MAKRIRFHVLLVFCLFIIASVSASAAVRFNAVLPQSNQLKTVAEYSVLKYASPTFGDLFGNVNGPAVKLTIDNLSATEAWVRIKARVMYNNSELAMVVFGKSGGNGGIQVPADSTVIYQLDPSGLDATDVINRVRANPETIKDYLDDFKDLDVMDSNYNSNVLSAEALESSFLNRNTLPNGRYTVEVSLYEYSNGMWTQVPGVDSRTFEILETTLTPISPRGAQGDTRPEALEFELAGFPAQVGCFTATVELTNAGAAVWTSNPTTVGSGSACQQSPTQGIARVRIPIPDSVRLTGGLDYSWSVKVKDQGGKTVAQTSATTFALANELPTVVIDGVGSQIQLRKDDAYTFEAVVEDTEDDILGFTTQLEWRVKEPGVAQVWKPSNTDTMTWTFRTEGRHVVELRATDKFGGVSTASVQVDVIQNALPQIAVSNVQYMRDSRVQDIPFTTNGHSIGLGKTVFRPGDQLLVSTSVSDPDGDTVSIIVRDKQQTLQTEQVTGSGEVGIAVQLSQQTNYNISIEAIDARDGKSVTQFEQLRVVPGSKPSVSILTPGRNERFAVGSAVTFRALAQDADDPNPAIVWYLVNGDQMEQIGSGASISYEVAEGSNRIKAVATATDPDSGQPKPEVATAEVTVIGFVVENQKPVVQINAPAEGLLFTAEDSDPTHTLTFTADAQDTDGPAALSYTWQVNGQPVSAAGPTLTHVFNGLGKWTVKVEVSDAKDTASAQVLVVVSRPATLDVEIAGLPSGGSIQLPQGYVLRPTASYGNLPNAEVTWLLGGSRLDGQPVVEHVVAEGNNPQIILNDAGQFVLKAIVVDGAVRGQAVREIEVTANNAPQVSSVTWTSPVFVGDTLSMSAGIANTGGSETVFVSVVDPDGDGISAVSWKAGDLPLGSTETIAYQFSKPGKHVLTVEVEDSRGAVGIGTVTVQVFHDEQPPHVVVAAPVQGSNVAVFSAVALSAQAADPEGAGRIAEQAWFIDGERLPAGQTSFVPTTPHVYTLTYSARDVAGNYGGATVQINATLPRLVITSPAVGEVVSLTREENGQTQAIVTLVSDLVDSGAEAEYSYRWYIQAANGEEQLSGEFVGQPTAQHRFTEPGTYSIRVEATPQAVPNAQPLQAVTSLVVLSPQLQGEGIDKTITPNIAPQITAAWVANPLAPETQLQAIAANQSVRLFADVVDPDNSGPISVVWDLAGVGIGVGTRVGQTNRYYVDVAISQPGNHALTVVATDARGERVARQVQINVTAHENQPPVINSISVPDSVSQGESMTLLASITDPEGQLVTVTWLLDKTPIASGSVTGTGSVSVDVSFQLAGNYRLVMRAIDANGGQVESEPQVVRVASTAEPIITSPAAPAGSISIVSNPVQFAAANVPQGASVRWVSSIDGELSRNETSFEAALSPGEHEITLWVDSVGVTVRIMAQEQAQLYQAVGLVVGWSGSPALLRPGIARGLGENDPAATIRFRSGARVEQYSAVERTVYDVDTLVLGENDRLEVLISATGRIKVFGPEANGLLLDSAGNLQ